MQTSVVNIRLQNSMLHPRAAEEGSQRKIKIKKQKFTRISFDNHSTVIVKLFKSTGKKEGLRKLGKWCKELSRLDFLGVLILLNPFHKNPFSFLPKWC